MCDNRYLALSGPFRIEGCACCGNVSIQLGPVTVRVDQKALRSLHEMTGEAMQRLSRLHADVVPPAADDPVLN